MKYLYLAALAISLTPSMALAQADADGLTVSGNVRLRYELIDGQARAGFDSADDLFNIRTQLAADYRALRRADLTCWPVQRPCPHQHHDAVPAD